MKIAVGSDHAGFEIKGRVLGWIEKLGHEPIDMGTHSEESCDYPFYAEQVARAVADGRTHLGVLVCGSGMGMSMAANKVHGVRAAVCHSKRAAELSRQHNDANILCLGARMNTVGDLEAILRRWLAAEFEGGRHQRRVDLVMEIEQTGCAEGAA
jgi:ribose 5-phosphate isomerase B